MGFEPTHLKTLNDNFIRTTMPQHISYVQKIWRILIKNDWLYEGKYTGWYCVGDEAFYAEDDLVKGEDGIFKTPLGKNVEWREDKSYFFRLSEFQEMLLKVYEKYPNLVRPESKKGEVISFVSGLTLSDYKAGKPLKKGHLTDLSVSRNNFEWGIKIPCDLKGNDLLEKGEWKADVAKDDRHVIYVWLDALFNYLTALGAETDDEDYKKYWTEYTGRKIHIVGKDILRFHAVYWPALLLAANYTREQISKMSVPDDNFAKYLPTSVFAHGWLTNDGQKISKSLGNGIYPAKEIEWLEKEFKLSREIARDYFKYYLHLSCPFGNDGDYSRVRMLEKINGDLANKVGNLAKRTLDLIYNNCDGKIPKVEKFDEIISVKSIVFENYVDSLDFISYTDEIIKIAETANKYIETKEPWKLKDNRVDMESVLYALANTILKIGILLQPLIPYLSQQLLKELGYNEPVMLSRFNGAIDGGQVILKPTILFPRLVNGE
jgi:methionyl-tRNA synthetase